jgi:hypothetical protein
MRENASVIFLSSVRFETVFLPPRFLPLHSFFTSLTTLARHLEERRTIAFKYFKVAGHLSSDSNDDFYDHSTF